MELSDLEKLTEDEMNQLKTLLIRYLAHRAEGVFNWAVDGLLAKFKSHTIIDVTPPAPTTSRPSNRKTQRPRALATEAAAKSKPEGDYL
jgi:hypothetical protein